MILTNSNTPTSNTRIHFNVTHHQTKSQIRHDVIWEYLAPHPSLLNDNIKDRFPETFDDQKELLKELVLLFSKTNDLPTHIIQYNATEEDIDPANDYHREKITRNPGIFFWP